MNETEGLKDTSHGSRADRQTADQQERIQRFQDATTQLATKAERPTVEEVEETLQRAKDLPVPDFGTWFEIEKERNTERYQEAVEETRRMLGKRIKTRRDLLRGLLLAISRKTSLVYV